MRNIKIDRNIRDEKTVRLNRFRRNGASWGDESNAMVTLDSITPKHGTKTLAVVMDNADVHITQNDNGTILVHVLNRVEKDKNQAVTKLIAIHDNKRTTMAPDSPFREPYDVQMLRAKTGKVNVTISTSEKV